MVDHQALDAIEVRLQRMNIELKEARTAVRQGNAVLEEIRDLLAEILNEVKNPLVNLTVTKGDIFHE